MYVQQIRLRQVPSQQDLVEDQQPNDAFHSYGLTQICTPLLLRWPESSLEYHGLLRVTRRPFEIGNEREVVPLVRCLEPNAEDADLESRSMVKQLYIGCRWMPPHI